jgi:positive regulator of sigma E activity
MSKKEKKNKIEFSKALLIQESILIWIMTIFFMFLSLVCIQREYFGELPWLAAMIGFPWTAYGVSQTYYYKKSTKENTKDGIKYETVMASITENLPHAEG